MAHHSPLPERLTIDTSLTPTPEEFQQALCILTHTHQANPSKLVQIINILYSFVEQRKEDYLCQAEPMRRMLIELYKVPEKRPGNQALFRKAAAKIYCYFANSFPRFKEYIQRYKLPFKPNQFQFRSTVASILTEAYRSIEKRVVANFQVLEIKPLDEKQVRSVEPILMNLDVHFTPQAAQLFRREVKNLFCLERFEENDLTRCYSFYHTLREKMEVRIKECPPLEVRALLQTLPGRKREKNKQIDKEKERDAFQPDFITYENFFYDLTGFKDIPKHHYIVQEHSPQIWTPTVQQEIVALFLQCDDIKKVSLRFQKKYGNQPQLLDHSRLKCKLIKIIRGSVRLLQQFYKQHMEDTNPPLPKMIEIDEDKVKLLIGSPYNIKAHLLEFFRQTVMSYRSLCQLINDINVFLRQKSLQRFQKSTASKAIIFSL